MMGMFYNDSSYVIEWFVLEKAAQYLLDFQD